MVVHPHNRLQVRTVADSQPRQASPEEAARPRRRITNDEHVQIVLTDDHAVGAALAKHDNFDTDPTTKPERRR
jgi:hypothetical protein